MNYLKLYFTIIRFAKEQNRIKNGESYYEEHHIKPKSCGGSNRKKNLVLLTAREHFICHALLAKVFKKNWKYRVSMMRAFYAMKAVNPHQKERYMNSRLFEYNKNLLYGQNKIVKNPRLGKKHSEETKKRMSEAAKGKKFSKEHRKNLSKNSARRGEKPWNTGLTMDEEHRKKLSESQMNIKVKCIHCNLITTKSRLSYHTKIKHKEKLNEEYNYS